MAESRIGRRAMFYLMLDGVKESWLPIAYVVGVGFYTRDARLILILVGMFLMTRPLMPLIHNQLRYVTRLLQYRHMMDGDLDGVLAHESKDSDLVYDYEVSAGVYDEAGVKTLDNRYYAFVHWLAAGLRSMGCDQETVEREALKFRNEVSRTVAEHKNAPSNP
jgi:hypothetical protein